MRESLLVFVDGTICDTRQRHLLRGTPAFYSGSSIMGDVPTPGSLETITHLSGSYEIVYMAARPAGAREATERWLSLFGFPPGPLYLADTLDERLAIARELKSQRSFRAGIGDRWDDNELHLEIGCMSIIVKEHEPNWATVVRHLS